MNYRPYHTKQCRTKVTKILSDKNFVQETLHNFVKIYLLAESDE